MSQADTDSIELTDADRVALWLAGSDGTAAVQRTLRQLNLPRSFDTDLVGKTIHAAERMMSRGDVIESVAGWSKRTLRLRGMDLLKSPRSSRARVSPDEAEEFGIDSDRLGAASLGGDVAALLVAMESDAIRRRIAGHVDGAYPWRVSAALTYLSVALDGCQPGVQCPAPVGGAGELDAAQWAGLFYAGQRHYFHDDGEADSATIRQRRKRHIDAVRGVLIDAYRRGQDGDHA